jgi:cytochrome c-type biogenesis protein
VIDAPLAYAFSAGMVAAVNPCGFPMLPAYLSFFIGADDDSSDRASRIPRALGSAAAVSLGFFVVFVGVGLPIDAGLDVLMEGVPWLTMAIGAALVAFGVSLLVGRGPRFTLPRLDKGGRTRRFGSMVLFGMSYAIASLGCTLPIFLIAVAGTTERANLLSGVSAFLAYAAGMSVVLLFVSLALALAREGMVRRMRSALRYVDLIAGVLLVGVGVYLTYYGYIARRDDAVESSAVSWVDDVSSELTSRLENGGVELGLVLATTILVALVWSYAIRRGSDSD